jgi:hypothetical protein
MRRLTSEGEDVNAGAEPTGVVERAVLPALMGEEIVGMLAGQLATADYAAQPNVPPNPDADRTYLTNDDLWADLTARGVWPGAVVTLDNFCLSEWLPQRPGLFYVNAWQREDAARLRVTKDGIDSVGDLNAHNLKEMRRDIDAIAGILGADESAELYYPSGKWSMIQGGVGCVRLKPRRLYGEDVWFLGASSTPVAHAGCVVALRTDLYATIAERMRSRGAVRCSLTGRLTFVPDELIALYGAAVGIHQLYVLVEELTLRDQDKDQRYLATGAVMVTKDPNAETSYSWAPRGVGAAYVTFEPGRPRSIGLACEWLAENYVEGFMGGRVVTDFDEQVRRFHGATFGLEVILDGRISTADADDLLDRFEANPYWRKLVTQKIEIINIGGVVGGDQYNVGQAAAVGPGAKAQNTTLVQGASSISAVNDPAALASDLERLRLELKQAAQSTEHDAALGILADAELTAKAGDADAAVKKLSALGYLASAGHWVLNTAATIGTTVAEAAVKSALGL